MYPFHIHWEIWGQTIGFGPYRLFLFLAIVIVCISSFLFSLRRGFTKKQTLLILVSLFLSAFVGARLLNILTHIPLYQAEPHKIFALEAEGFSLYGGILLSVLTGYVVCKMLKINHYRFADTLMPLAGLGIAIYRMGCLLHGCCFGRVTDLPWGVTFPLLSPAHIYQLGAHGSFFSVRPVHPTQLYEMLAALLLAAVAYYLVRKKKKDGTALIVFMTGFTLFRMANDTLRVETETFIMPGYFYLIVYLLCLMILAYVTFRTWQPKSRKNSVVA